MNKNPKFVELAEIFFEQSKDDLKQAKLFSKSQEFPKSAMMSVQAAMNALTAISISNKRMQNPTYSLSELFKIVKSQEEELDDLSQNCDELDLVQDLSPFKFAHRQGKFMSEDLVKEFPKKAEEVIRACKKLIKKKKLFSLPFSIGL